MTLPVDQISNELSSLVKRLDFGKLPLAQSEAQLSQLSSQVSQLGTQVGQTTGGFMSLTQELDIPTEVLGDTLSQMQAAAADFSGGQTFGLQEELENIGGVVNRGIVMLAENPPGLQIQNAVSSANAALESLTEGTVGGGFNNINITANTPEAMAKVMSSVGGVPISQARAALGEIVPGVDQLQSNLDGVVNNLQSNLPVINSLTQQVSSFGSNIKETIGDVISAKGFLNDTVEKLSGSIKNDIRGLVADNLNIPDGTLEFAKTLVQNKTFDVATDAINAFSNLTPEEITEALAVIDTSLSRDITKSTIETPSPVSTISPTARPSDPDQPVRNTSVVYGLLNSIDRDVTELVFRTAPIFDAEPRLKASDFSSYHFIIQADGTLTRPAALNEKLNVPGHENFSIGIVVATKNNKLFESQTSTLDRIIRAFLSLVPHGQIVNYTDIISAINGSRSDTTVDFADYAEKHFGYKSIMGIPTRSLSTAQIQSRIKDGSEGVYNEEPVVTEPVETNVYPFIHPDDQGGAASIWTFDFGDRAREHVFEQLRPFNNPTAVDQKIFFRINSDGGKIRVAIAETSNYTSSGFTWFVYTLDELIGDGVPVDEAILSRQNKIRRPVN